MANRFFTQVLGKLHLKPDYLAESFSLQRLRLMDAHGNYYGLYHSQFIFFSNYLKNKNLDIDQLTAAEIVAELAILNNEKRLSLQLYFCTSYLLQFLFDANHSSFDTNNSPISVSGKALEKKGVQNCVVMHQDGSIYIHPKVRGSLTMNQAGVCHASLAPLDGSAIAFAGCFVHTERGWILENTSGHYGPRITQLRAFVKKLFDLGLDIRPLTIKCWIPNAKDSIHEYTHIEENALEFLERTSQNTMRLEEILKNSHLKLNT